MSNKEWLYARGQEITPTASDKSQLQSALDVVSAKLLQEVSIAQVRPCGSAATLFRRTRVSSWLMIAASRAAR